ncbi:MAG: D-glycerate dehydrogenase [Planctomycetota bacterium]
MREFCDVFVWPQSTPPTRGELIRNVAECDGILTLLSETIDAGVMEAAGPQLQVISNYAVGYNNIDVREASRRGIRVGNTPDVLTDATADLSVALLLAAARHMRVASHQVSSGQWSTWQPDGFLGAEIAGRTLGIVGMGRIGAAAASRLVRGWGMKLLYTSRQDSAVGESLGGRRVSLAECLGNSDFVSIHVALTDATRHLIDAEALRSMSTNATLVNTARGEIIDQDALVRHCQEHHQFTVGLDVTTPEPIAADHPLVQLPNVIITPHIGSATTRARHAMADIAVDNVLGGLGLVGQSMRHEVHLDNQGCS